MCVAENTLIALKDSKVDNHIVLHCDFISLYIGIQREQMYSFLEDKKKSLCSLKDACEEQKKILVQLLYDIV